MSETSENRKLRFVILFHEFPAGTEGQNHWDLMLERGDELLTWRLDKFPDGEDFDAIENVKATPLANHRIEYLDYEGPVTGNRGSVKRINQGTYTLGNANPKDADLGECSIEFTKILVMSTVGNPTERNGYHLLLHYGAGIYGIVFHDLEHLTIHSVDSRIGH